MSSVLKSQNELIGLFTEAAADKAGLAGHLPAKTC